MAPCVSCAPGCTELAVEWDRGFESSSLQRRVKDELGNRLRSEPLLAFYRDLLGFRVSDYVLGSCSGLRSRAGKLPARARGAAD
jgi:hypothetical protein